MTVITASPMPRKSGAIRKHAGLLLMLVPVVAYYIIFHYIPMYGVMIAFKDFNMGDGIWGSPWCGLHNFVRLFSSKDFPNALHNTIIISLLRLSFGFLAPVVLALLLNELRVAWYKRAVQTLTYLPFFLSWVILGGIFLMLFNTSGPINAVVTSLGMPPVTFLTNNAWFLFTLIITGIWQGMGYGAVIFLAALAGISPTLYEAGAMDGANRWRLMWHITLPALVPTIITLFILNLGGILNAGFDQIYNMYNPLVYHSSDIIDTYVLRRLTTLDFGLATAAGLFKSAVGLVLVMIVNTIARHTSGGEQGVW